MLLQEKDKMEKVISDATKICVGPEIDIHYHIPQTTLSEENDLKNMPYIEFSYVNENGHLHTQKMTIRSAYLEKKPEDLMNLVTFNLENFISEIDTVLYGAQ